MKATRTKRLFKKDFNGGCTDLGIEIMKAFESQTQHIMRHHKTIDVHDLYYIACNAFSYAIVMECAQERAREEQKVKLTKRR